VVRLVDGARLQGKVAETLPPGEVRRASEGTLERQRRFPLDTANALRGRLRREGFSIYKKGSKGASYVCAVRRKPGMDLDEFHTYWLEQHGPLNRDDADIRRFFLAYEQNHRLRSDYDRPGCDIDGVTIQTFASASKFFEMAMDPIYEARIHPDELKFLARDNLIWMLTDAEDLILDRSAD
jgi:hypothetical protein